MADGARASELARLLGVGLTTLQRWRRQFARDSDGVDCRKGRHRHVAHRLSEEERQRILLTCSEPAFAALPPGQIVPVLADRGLYIGSERADQQRHAPATDPARGQRQRHARRHAGEPAGGAGRAQILPEAKGVE